MTVATVVITAAAMLFALGYRFDRQSLSFEQGGLIQLMSSPEAAQVIINGKLQPYVTPGKTDLPPGEHTVELRKQGYRPWSKTVQLAAGQLLWLNYERLFPESIETGAAREFDVLAGVKTSPDRRWMILQTAAERPEFAIANIADEQNIQTVPLTIPEASLTPRPDAPRTFTLLEWDLTSRYVLVKYQAGDLTEYLRLDRAQPAQVINITQAFSLPVDEIHFAGDNANLVYVKNGTVLRRLDLGSNNATGALVTGLRDFTVYGTGLVAYTAERERTPGDAGSKYQFAGIFADNKEVPVREYPMEHTLLIDYTEYFNKGYLAVADTSGTSVDIIRDPSQTGAKDNRVFTTMQLKEPAAWLDFSDNGRMLLAQTGNQAATYDLEIAKQYDFTVQTAAPVTRPFTWIDDYYLFTDANRTIKLLEFDGANARDITGAEEGFGAAFTSDNQNLLSVGRDSATGTYKLQLSRLILQQ